jgi:hypothetical protein
MMKLQGIVSEIPTVKSVKTENVVTFVPTVEKQVEVFIEEFKPSTHAFVPTARMNPLNMGRIEKKRSRRRLILGVTITAFLAGVAILGISALVGNKQDKLETKLEWAVVHVEQGDTIWNLVQEHEGNRKHDTRDLVEMVKAHNHLPNVALQVGMKIEIPVYKEVK